MYRTLVFNNFVTLKIISLAAFEESFSDSYSNFFPSISRFAFHFNLVSPHCPISFYVIFIPYRQAGNEFRISLYSEGFINLYWIQTETYYSSSKRENFQ